jgi:hypothetical protein
VGALLYAWVRTENLLPCAVLPYAMLPARY